MEQKKYSERITDQLIELLKKGTAPWQIPWKPGQGGYLPNNPISKRRYNGINSLVLQYTQMLKGYEDNRWLTYQQAKTIGAEVRKGEKSTTVQYWKFYEDKKKLDEKGQVVLDTFGQLIIERFRLEHPRIFFFSVFNANQIEGMPQLQKDAQQWSDLEQAETMLKASKAVLFHNNQSGAFYRISDDTITVPVKERFDHAADYYATALHELAHWTGHESRLNRDMAHPFGSVEYGREELRAEIASMMLGSDLGIGHDPSNHASYVNAWIQILQDDPLEIFRASSDAEQIRNYLNRLVNQQQISADIDSEVSHQISVSQQTTKTYRDIATLTLANIEERDRLMAGYEREAKDAIVMVAESLRSYRNGNLPEKDYAQFAYQKLKIALPASWNGKAYVREYAGEQDFDDQVTVWRVYAQQTDNSDLWLADCKDQHQAQALTDKLRLIDALSIEDEFERSVKLARFNEDRLYANPHSTQEEMNAANDQRVRAEAAAQLYHDTMMGLSMNNDTHKTQMGKTVEIPLETNQSLDTAATQRLYLVVPYIEKGQAKAAGARWDRVFKSWYVDRSKVDVSKVEKWLPKNVVNIAIHTPQEQFTQFLSASGAQIHDQQIIMNGKKHRIRVPGDKGGEKSGVYIGYLDGKPAGYFKNFRTSVEMRWKSDIVQLSDQQKQALIEQAEEKLKLRHELECEMQQNTAKAIEEFLQYTQLARETGHAYLALKNVRGGDLRVVANEQEVYADSLVRIARDRKEAKQLRDQNPDSLVLTLGDLLIPVQDIDGAIWGVQIIQADGTKFYSKHTRKEQNFHIVGCEQSQLNALKHAKAIVIAEGFATADTLSQAIGWPVVMAFDSGNLPAVAQVLKEQFPDKPFIIAGDDDYQLETKGEVNVGKQKALEAAKLVGGIAVFPTFAPEEQSRDHLNDFNDLANKSILGMDAVKKQVGCAIDQVSQQMTQTNRQIVQKQAETVVARR